MVCPVLANQDFTRKPILRTYFFCQSRFWAMFCSSQLLNQMFQSSLFSCSWPKVPPLTVASLGLVKGVTQTSSQSKAHSLDSTPPKSSSSIMPPWSAEISRRTACSSTSGTGFLREVQGQARSLGEMLQEALGCKRYISGGEDTRWAVSSMGPLENRGASSPEDYGVSPSMDIRRGDEGPL